MQSKPLAATTLRGNAIVTSRSISATVGVSRRGMIPALALLSARVKIAIPACAAPGPVGGFGEAAGGEGERRHGGRGRLVAGLGERKIDVTAGHDASSRNSTGP